MRSTFSTPSENSSNSIIVHAISLSYFGHMHSLRSKNANIFNFLVGQLSIPMLVTLREIGASFFYTIEHVIAVITYPEMIRVDATRIIARMTNQLSVGYGSFKKLIGQAMSAIVLASDGEISVSRSLSDGADPQPTSSRAASGVNLRDKTLSDMFRCHVSYCSNEVG